MESIGKIIGEKFKNNNFTSRQQLLMARGFCWGKYVAIIDKGEEERALPWLDRFKELSHKAKRCQQYLGLGNNICINCPDCPNEYKKSNRNVSVYGEERF